MQHNLNSYQAQAMPQRQQHNRNHRNKGAMMPQQPPTILQHTAGMPQPTVIQQGTVAYANSIPPTSIMPPYQTTPLQKPAPPPVSQNGIIHLKGGAAVAAQNGTTVPSSEQQQQQTTPEENQEENTESTSSPTNEALANTKEKTPMCLINELARYNKISHQYTLDDEQGPAHKKTFFVTLKLGDNETYVENGPSIKKAQHAAASMALEKTAYTHPPPKPPKIRTAHDPNNITPTVELNALAMKRGEQTFYKPLDTRYPHYAHNYNYRGVYNQRYHYPRMPRVFYVSLKVGQREFIGEGHNRQDARNDAAAKALNILKKLPLPSDDSKKPDSDKTETSEKDLLKSEISLVHEIALRRNLSVVFDVIRESGPPHMKSFVTKCRVGEYETEAEGNSKKVSKKKSAELMLDKLRELTPIPPAIQKPKSKPNQNKKKSKNIIKQNQKTDPSYGIGINPISRLIQVQQAEQKKEPIFTLVTERSLLRRREFVMQVQIDDKTCTGVGPNKKLAKRHAAEQMLTLLGYNKPSPQPPKPAIKQATTPEQSSTGEKKVTFQEKTETTVPVSNSSSGEIANGKSGRQLMPGLLLLRDNNYTTGAQNMYQAQPPMTEPLVFGAGHMRPELQLRDIATKSKLEIKFDEFAGKNTEILCRVTLLTNPHQMFHGTGPNSDYAKDAAALEALKFLAELGKKEEMKMKMAQGDGPHMKSEDQLANSSIGGAPGRVVTM